MLKNISRRAIPQRRGHSTALRWPLDEKERLSQRLQTIEAHWKEKLDREAEVAWKKKNAAGENKYILSMFPYPSGKLHMGHMRVYTISDVTARYYLLNGYKVIHPIGWDAFGLPAENAARERGVDPGEWTRSNIAGMREQFARTGVQFDWSREVSTCEPAFYQWTQWIFLKLFQHGLVKRTLAEVNWDPVDGTVLAAEQIDQEGRSWRSGAVAEKRQLRQWMVETPRYAKRLQDGLKRVEQWHEVADIQSNWIGICDVYRFLFPLRDVASGGGSGGQPRQEILDLRLRDAVTVASSWFVVLRQGHALSDPQKADASQPYLLDLTVLNGVTGEWMPIVVVPDDYQAAGAPEMFLKARLGCSQADRTLVDQFGLKRQKKAVMSMSLDDVQEIASFGGYGGYQTSRSLLDWVVSRQRAWGTPIPMILAEDERSYVPVEENQLPLLQGQKQTRRTRVDCGKLPQGYGYYDTDTLDTFFDSSWYYLRFLDPHNRTRLISPEAARQMPVDIYVGGVEHAAVHMFFARFISHFLTDIGITSAAEPFRHLIPQGIVKGRTYIEPETGKYHRNEDVVMDGTTPKAKDGSRLDVVFEKMSKSKHNGVDPLDVLQRDGVDLTRLQILEAAAPRQPINWGETDLKGTKKWLDRVAWVVNAFLEGKAEQVDPKIEAELTESYNFFVRNVGMCLEVLNLHNTGLMRIMGFTNVLRKLSPDVLASSQAAQRCLVALLTMMQVYVPHTANEMWTAVRGGLREEMRETALIDVPWPQVDDDCAIDFMLYIDNVSCGRYAIPRKQIEDLEQEQLIRRSLTGEHRQFVERLRSKGADLAEITVAQRRGFHVTVTARLVGAETALIGKVLDELQSEYTAAKKAKRRAATKAY